MKLSAKMIGEQLGITAKEVNKLLKKAGYLKGVPGKWELTSLAKGYSEIRKKTNGYGGYAKREWAFILWDSSIVPILKKFISK